MANAATPTNVPTTDNSVDREKMSVQTIGFPVVEDTMSAETLAEIALPVLARVPRLEMGPEVGAKLELATDFEVETPTIEAPSLDEARQYRLDSSPAPSIQLHQPEEQISPQRLDLPHDSMEVPVENLEVSIENDVPTIVTSSPATSSPLRVLRQVELTSTGDRISAYLLRLQLMLKPLARIILLAALLTASALAYMLLEDNHVPLIPLKQQVVPTPNRPSETRLTRKPTSIGPSSRIGTGPVLRPSRILSAVGPGSKQAPSKHHMTDKHHETMTLASESSKSLPQPLLPSRNQVPTSNRIPAATQVVQSPTGPASYLNTGLPDRTPSQGIPLTIATKPIATKAGPSAKQNGRPIAVAELTGSIQKPIQR